VVRPERKVKKEGRFKIREKIERGKRKRPLLKRKANKRKGKPAKKYLAKKKKEESPGKNIIKRGERRKTKDKKESSAKKKCDVGKKGETQRE